MFQYSQNKVPQVIVDSDREKLIENGEWNVRRVPHMWTRLILQNKSAQKKTLYISCAFLN